MAGELNSGEVRQIARLLREAPDMTVAAAVRLLEQTTDDRPPATDDGLSSPQLSGSAASLSDDNEPRGTTLIGDPLRPARVGAPTSIERLDWVRGHLARIDRHGLSAAERQEMLRLLRLIQEDVASLMSALQGGDDRREF
jgi:hypothetical protein